MTHPAPRPKVSLTIRRSGVLIHGAARAGPGRGAMSPAPWSRRAATVAAATKKTAVSGRAVAGHAYAREALATLRAFAGG